MNNKFKKGETDNIKMKQGRNDGHIKQSWTRFAVKAKHQLEINIKVNN